MSVETKNTLFPNWAPPSYPQWLGRLKGPKGSALRTGFSYMPEAIRLAQADGLDQLIPIIAATRMWPRDIRKSMGKAVWREYHHATEATNAKRARIWLHHGGQVPWEEIAHIKPTHLVKVIIGMHQQRWSTAHYVGSNAPLGEYNNVFMLWVDTERMGVIPSPKWSLNRLKREHDALALKAAMAKHSAQTWAAPFVFECAGYRFERLVSDLDLAQEGLSQRHCVASYQTEAKRGDYIVLRVSGKERATFGFGVNSYDQLKGFANSEVSKECRAASVEAKKAYIAQVVVAHKSKGTA